MSEAGVPAAPPGGAPSYSTVQQLGGGLVLFTWFLMLWLSFPGLDNIPGGYADTPEEREEIRERPLGLLELAVVDLNAKVRQPTLRPLNRIFERPLRLKQNFFLYRNGVYKVHYASIFVDDELVFRTNDPEHDWKSSHLAMRRVRPVAETTFRDRNPQSWKGLIRWLGREAEAEFGARTLRITAERGPFPGEKLTPFIEYTASAPDWDAEVRRLNEPLKRKKGKKP